MNSKPCKSCLILVMAVFLISIGVAAFYLMFRPMAPKPADNLEKSTNFTGFSDSGIITPILENANPPIKPRNSRNFFNENCGTTKLHNRRLQYGETAEIKAFPWMAALFYKNLTDESVKFGCGGSLIDKDLVLTAAHCLEIRGVELHFIRLGEQDLSTDPDCKTHIDGRKECADPVQDIYTFTKFIHSDFEHNNGSDIGLIKLHEAAKVEQNNINTICLPIDSPKLPNEVSVIGFGLVGFEAVTHPHASKLQYARMSVYANSECESIFMRKKFTSREVLSSKLFCAMGKNATIKADVTVCRGDSGGPAMDRVNEQYVQVGIVSAGTPICGRYKKEPSIFVKIFEFLEWIRENSE